MWIYQGYRANAVVVSIGQVSKYIGYFNDMQGIEKVGKTVIWRDNNVNRQEAG